MAFVHLFCCLNMHAENVQLMEYIKLNMCIHLVSVTSNNF